MRHPIGRLAALMGALVLILTATAAATPAYAAGQLELSADGVTWTTANAPLQFGNPVWVPGDTDQASMLVRNASDQRASVRARVMIEDRLPTDVRMTARLGGGPVHMIERSGDTTNQVVLAPNATARIALEVVVGDNAVMRESATVRLVFHASGAGELPGHGVGDEAAVDPGADQADRPPGEIAAAGAPDIGWLVLLGTLLAALGIALIARRRRDGTDEEVSPS